MVVSKRRECRSYWGAEVPGASSEDDVELTLENMGKFVAKRREGAGEPGKSQGRPDAPLEANVQLWLHPQDVGAIAASLGGFLEKRKQ